MTHRPLETVVRQAPGRGRRRVARSGPMMKRRFPLLALAWLMIWILPAGAQDTTPGGWTTGLPVPAPGATTVIERRAPPTAIAPDTALLTLEAVLTAEPGPGSRRIERGLIWRVFALGGGAQGAKLLVTHREAAPTLKLPPGRYAVNAAYGRANLTQIVTIEAGRQLKQSFVLNAGGLRVIVKVAGEAKFALDKERYDIFSDERDQSGERQRVVSNVRPGLITRLNSGIYRIVSRLGDANALVSADVAVEAGKLTEATVNHEAGKVTFKLVKSAAGEAHADTQWIIMTQSGDIVKETAGALPTHILAPGDYTVSARWGGKLFTRTFALKSGENIEVEVMMQ